MAVKYKVTIRSISTDGTNIYLEIEVFDGEHTLPTLRPSFDKNITAAEIDTYVQAIADAAPTLAESIYSLVGKVYTQS